MKNRIIMILAMLFGFMCFLLFMFCTRGEYIKKVADYDNKQDETRKKIKASPDMAIDMIRKYQKIEKIINAPIGGTSAKYNAIVNLIKYSEVLEDENVDC